MEFVQQSIEHKNARQVGPMEVAIGNPRRYRESRCFLRPCKYLRLYPQCWLAMKPAPTA